LKDHAHGTKKAAPFIEDTIINVAHYGEFLGALETILSDYDMTYTYAGHIGDGSIRLIPLVDLEAPNAAETIFELAKRVYDLVFAFDGSMSVDHNDGLIRTPFLPAMYGEEVCSLFERVKTILDPNNIFNPGKKVNGDLQYSMKHVLKTNKPTGLL
jgi:glycolate oxidase